MHYNKISIMNNVIMIFLNVRVSRVSSWVSGPPWIGRILNIMMIHDYVILNDISHFRRKKVVSNKIVKHVTCELNGCETL